MKQRLVRKSDTEMHQIETTIQRDKFFEDVKNNKWKMFFLIFNFYNLFTLLSIIFLIIHFSFILYSIIVYYIDVPNIGLNLLQPISFFLFSLFHSINTLGFIQSFLFFIITTLIHIISELCHDYIDTPFQRFYSLSFDEILYFFMILYPIFCISEIIMYGTLNTRYQEEVEKRTNIFKLIKLSLLTGLFMVGHQIVIEPIGIFANLWNYNSNGFYFGSSTMTFFALFIETMFIILIYLILEFLIDFIVLKYEKIKFLKPPIYGQHNIIIILTSLLPLIGYFIHSLTYLFIVHPPFLRIISFFTMVVPLLLALNSIEFQSKEQVDYVPIE